MRAEIEFLNPLGVAGWKFLNVAFKGGDLGGEDKLPLGGICRGGDEDGGVLVGLPGWGGELVACLGGMLIDDDDDNEVDILRLLR
jgi:hypothetical protein